MLRFNMYTCSDFNLSYRKESAEKETQTDPYVSKSDGFYLIRFGDYSCVRFAQFKEPTCR